MKKVVYFFKNTLVLSIFFTILLLSQYVEAITVRGVINASTRWTKNMSPVIINGDLLIGKSATLTIDAGVDIQIAAKPYTTSQIRGRDSRLVEIIIQGTLQATGTAQQRIFFQKNPISWYGIRVEKGGKLHLTYANIAHTRHHGVENLGTATLRYVELTKARLSGVYGENCTTEISHSKIYQNTKNAIEHTNGNLIVQYSEIIRNTQGIGIWIRAGSGRYKVSLQNNTITLNGLQGIAVDYSRGTIASIAIQNNIVVQNGTEKLFEVIVAYPMTVCSNNLVWHGKVGYEVKRSRFARSCLEHISYKPLFVDATKNDFRLLDRSPARKKGTKGQDLGAHPWTTHRTNILHGYLYQDLTLPAGTHQATGDLIVDKGVTLTLQAGATLKFAQTDDLEGGRSKGLSRLKIHGKVKTYGTSSKPVIIRSDVQTPGATGSWEGIYLDSGEATFQHTKVMSGLTGVNVSKGSTLSASHTEFIYTRGGIDNYGTVVLHNCLLAHTQRTALTHSEGTLSIHASKFMKNRYGLEIYAGKISISKSIISENIGIGLYQEGGAMEIKHTLFFRNGSTGLSMALDLTIPSSALIDHVTSVYNKGDGIRTYNRNTKLHKITIQNSIFARNGGYELHQKEYGGTCKNNLAWDTSGTFVYIRQGARCTNTINKNPLFIDETKNDYRLKSTSPAKRKATDGTDLGAHASGGGTNPIPTRLSIIPITVELSAGQKQTFHAKAYDSKGIPVPGITVTWKVVRGGGSISASGVFTAGSKAGTYTNTIEASSGTLKAYASVKIKATASGIAKIVITPNGGTLQPGKQLRFRASAKDAQGKTVSGQSFTWSLPSGGGTLTPSSGLKTQATFTAGNKSGTYQVSAKTGGISAQVSVTIQGGSTSPKLARLVVTPSTTSVQTGKTLQFGVKGYDSTGKLMTGFPVYWSISSGGGSINSKGLLNAGSKAGRFIVTAASGSIRGTATVTILDPKAGKLAKIVVTPGSATVQIGKSFLFKATGYDVYHKVVPNVSLLWSVSKGAGSIDSKGLFKAGASIGRYTLTVKNGSIQATAAITIVDPQAGKVFRIIVSPASITLQTGNKAQFSAVGYDKYNKPTPNFLPKWTVSGGGNITSKGLFTAGNQAGSYTVTAENAGIKSTAKVQITTQQVLTLPKPRTPKDGAKVTTLRPVFEVINAVDPQGKKVTLDIEVDLSPTFDSQMKQVKYKLPQGNSGITRWTIGKPLRENQAYSWRVRASNGSSTTAWIFGGGFQIDSQNDLPSAPEPKLPANGAVQSSTAVTLTIVNAKDPDGDSLSYHFQIADTKDFSSSLEEQQGIPSGKAETSWQPKGLQKGKSYFWRARAYDGQGSGAWSKVFNIVIKAPQKEPTPEFPSERVSEPIQDAGNIGAEGQPNADGGSIEGTSAKENEQRQDDTNGTQDHSNSSEQGCSCAVDRKTPSYPLGLGLFLFAFLGLIRTRRK